MTDVPKRTFSLFCLIVLFIFRHRRMQISGLDGLHVVTLAASIAESVRPVGILT